MIPDKTTKYSGPPGTGKSTTLLNVIEQLLSSGVDPAHIVFTTFTRAGAYEARDRACARFKLPEQSFPYFRTLHSLCFQLLPTKEVMGPADWIAIGKHLGLMFGIKWNGRNKGDLTGSQEETSGFNAGTRGDYLMSLWSLARVKRQPLTTIMRDVHTRSGQYHDVTLAEVEHFAASVKNYKTEFGKMDYTDMLEAYLAEGQPVMAKFVIVDEAQDLSRLQWEVVHKLCRHAEQVWIAGDDDQCIHEWNGADVRTFIDLQAEHVVLPQSHRIPGSVHRFAAKIIDKVKVRIPKEYRPRDEEGRVNLLADLEQLDLAKESWLLLARNQCFLKEYAELCRRRGLLFAGMGVKAFDEKSLGAIRSWHALQRGEAITKAAAEEMYGLMSQRDRIRWGFKKQLSLATDAAFDYETLRTKLGLCAPKDLTWVQALDMMRPDEAVYLMAVERRGGFDQASRIEISTIHGAKGKEADNVVLRPEMTQRTHDGFLREPEPEHRVWYVGATRARKNLFILNSTSDLCYPL